MTCTLCPRKCGVDRAAAPGRCGVRETPVAARAALHFGEEPCFGRSVGAIFFCGCALRCVFCQNRRILDGTHGKELSAGRLCEIFLELQSQGASALDLVTGSQFAPFIARALDLAARDLKVPVIWNSSGYESPEILELLQGRVQIYLPDFKFGTSKVARRLAGAPDYPEIAQNTIFHMARAAGKPRFDANGVLQGGVVVRHLVLPGFVSDSLKVLERLDALFSDKSALILSLMRQYTPVDGQEPPLNRRVTTLEYEKVLAAARAYGFSGYLQERDSATEDAIPAFDGTGV